MEADTKASWHPWVVAQGSGFEVAVMDPKADGKATVPLDQVNVNEFRVGRRFRFRHPAVEDKIVKHLAKIGVFDSDDERRNAVTLASDYDGTGDLTDLASVPPFLRWFVNSYGSHTLAAILHDEWIRKKPNSGALRSDVVADRYFREMLHAVGTPTMKRWVIWTAVALRTRWMRGGRRRLQLVLWALLGALNIGITIWLMANGRYLAAAVFALASAVPAGSLWGRQWGAAVISAVALPLVAPAGALVLVATAGLRLLDRLTARFEAPVPPPGSFRSAGG